MVMIMLGLIISPGVMTNNHQPNFDLQDDAKIEKAYEYHRSIEILCNEDFKTQGWPGKGTAESPYIIENLSIAVSVKTAIKIADTDAYFIIRNCLIVHINPNDVRIWGIILFVRTTNGVIESCEWVNAGIQLNECENCTVRNNVGRESDAILSIYRSQNVTIRNNTFSDSYAYIDSTNRSRIQFNQFKRTNVNFYNCKQVDMRGNRFIKCAFYYSHVEEFLTFNLDDNIIDDLPVGFFVNETGLNIRPSEYSRVFVVNSTDVRIENTILARGGVAITIYLTKNVLINNILLTQHGKSVISWLVDHQGIDCIASENITVKNIILQGRGVGLNFYDSTSVTITSSQFISTRGVYGLYSSLTIKNSKFMDSDYDGIFVVGGRNSTIFGNLFKNLGNAINFYYSENGTVENNTVIRCDKGVNVYETNSTVIRYNRIIESKTGVNLQASRSCNVFSNVISKSKAIGIDVLLAVDNLICDNKVYLNKRGIRLDYSINNVIFGNHFSLNNDYDALEEMHDNQWDDGIGQGNFWTRCTEEPLRINGSTLSVDHFPKVSDIDEDGLTDAREFELGTDIDNPDSDGDGVNDSVEVEIGSNPLIPNSYSLTEIAPGLMIMAVMIVGVIIWTKRYYRATLKRYSL